MSTAILHDIALEEGGGVKICRAMADVLNADIYVGYRPDGVFTEAQRVLPQTFRSYPTLRNIYAMFGMRAPSKIRQYDTVIQSGCGTDWYIPSSEQTLIRYVHSPAPGAYKSSGIKSAISRQLREPTWSYPEKIFVNSSQTLKEINTLVGVDGEILYPPVDTSSFYHEDSKDYYLIISRLTEGKNIMSVVEYFSNSGKELVVCGSGELANKIKQFDVDFRGWITEKEKRKVLSNCEAVIMPSGVESFGIVAVEAFASGKPVYAKKGGALDDIISETTGVLYDSIKNVRWEQSFDAEQIQSYAEEYDISKFRQKLLDATS